MALPPYMFPWSQPFQSEATTTPFDPSQFAGIWNAVSGQQMGQSEAGIRRLFGESRKAAVDPYREQIRAQAAEQGRGPGAGVDLSQEMDVEARQFQLPMLQAILGAQESGLERQAGMAGRMITPTSRSYARGGGGTGGGAGGSEWNPGQGGSQGFGGGGIADVLLAGRLGLPTGMSKGQERLLGHYGVSGAAKRGSWGAGVGKSSIWPVNWS